MKKIKSTILLVLFSFYLFGCSSVARTLRNEKIEADEFLVKKIEPLSMPPDFDTLPSPGDGSQEALKEKEALEKLFNVRKDSSTKKSNSKSTENSILKQIQK